MKRLKRKRKRGFPKHIPTTKNRIKVRDLAAVGYATPEIADNIGISIMTLYKHYDHALANSKRDLLALATNGLRRCLRTRKPWAICFVLKTQGKQFGWTERLEYTGADGKQLFDLSKLTDAQLKTLEDLVVTAGEAAGITQTRQPEQSPEPTANNPGTPKTVH